MAQGRPQEVEELLSHPRALCNIWRFLDTASRVALQASDLNLHADLRWFALRLPPIVDTSARSGRHSGTANRSRPAST